MIQINLWNINNNELTDEILEQILMKASKYNPVYSYKYFILYKIKNENKTIDFILWIKPRTPKKLKETFWVDIFKENLEMELKILKSKAVFKNYDFISKSSDGLTPEGLLDQIYELWDPICEISAKIEFGPGKKDLNKKDQ